jgi:DNA-binding CsgD family transcriptional regulator/ligand-binding sensor domain-containing protein
MNKSLLFFLFFCFCCTVSTSQELPPITNYTPGIYKAGTQNWGISQDENKLVYIANNEGLLTYNGAKWSLLPSPNNTIIRSVLANENKVYIGSYMDFGYWQKGENTTQQYVSLSTTLDIQLLEDEQFWTVVSYSDWILFQSLSNIYIVNISTNEYSKISSENTIHKLFKVEDRIYFYVINEGLYTITNGKKKLLYNASSFENDIIVSVLSVDDDVIAVTQKNGLYKMDEEGLSPWNSILNSEINNYSIYTAITLSDTSFVLGTIGSGVLRYSKNGTLLQTINKFNGLGDNTALALFEDQDSNVWVGLDNGVGCVNIASSFTNYIDRSGRLGTTYASIVFNDILYLGTNQGLFYKSLHTKNDFKLIKRTDGQVWYLKQVGNTLLCGHNTGTFQIKKDQATLISSIRGAWVLKEVPDNPSILLQGTFNGLCILKKEGGNWKLKNRVDGFDISSRYIEFADAHKVLVSHEYKGVYKLELNSDFSKVITKQKDTSVTKGSNSSIISFDGVLFYANEKGVYSYDALKDTFILNTTLSSIFSNNTYVSGKLINEANKKLWMFTKNGIVFVDKIPLNDSYKVTEIPLRFDLRNEKKGYENISKFSSTSYLLGTSNGYLLFDINAVYHNEYTVSLDEVSVGLTKERVVPINKLTEFDFEAAQNSFFFEFSVPEYNKYITTQYQYMLEGNANNDQWNEWTSKSSIFYENLNYGSYVFKVRSKVNNQIQEKIASYEFEIKRPWYLTNYAIVAYSLLFILFFIIINAGYKQNYKKHKKRLLERGNKEIALKELENQKEIIQLKNEKLQQDIEARNRELAISTMSMIKKNNVLNEFKDDILLLGSDKNLKPLLAKIDNSINNNEDWKFFEEAFNHADKDFLKKVRSKHSLLTPNDLRLCAYLRLNLSSKEIAPLLNISPRSVEVKRYRLRKKMDLPHKTSLTNYILEI